jgi:hypothetical protein
MNQTTKHKQIRLVLERRLKAPLTDPEVEGLGGLPLASHICATDPRGVDGFLRGLPDDLLTRLRRLAHDFFEWSDLGKPETWPAELTVLAALLYPAEVEAESVTDEEMSFAVGRLAGLSLIECARRDGRYSFVAPYSLAQAGEPARIPARERLTEH